jgi:hypothetical protein
MITLDVAIAAVITITSFHCQVGMASQYAPGVMERTIRVRQAGRTSHTLPGHLPDVDGFVASREGRDIGKTWTIYYDRQCGRFLVADCAGKNDRRIQDGLSGYQWMMQKGILVEVDHLTAKRWGVIGKAAKVEVCTEQIRSR